MRIYNQWKRVDGCMGISLFTAWYTKYHWGIALLGFVFEFMKRQPQMPKSKQMA